jgi:transcription antitermination factor NusG
MAVACPNVDWEGGYMSLVSDGRSVAPLSWFGVRTRSRCESLTATILKNKGYEPYLPVYRKRRHWSDRTVMLESALFPGYVFCRFDPKKRLPVITTPGVISIISCGTEPAPIPEEQMRAVQELERSGLASVPWPYAKVGDRVRVTRGALEGVEGVLIREKNEYRFIVSIDLLQRSVATEIDRDWVEPIK